jgi:rhamnosyltransferase
MRLCAAVILYHPDSGIKDRLLTYLPTVEKLLLFDNSEAHNYQYLINELPSNDKIVYVSDGENKGISIRLNQAAQMAINEQFDWLLTMDQDSYFANNNFENFLTCLKNYPDKRNVAVFGVQYLDSALQGTSCHGVTTNHLITSGSIMNLHLFLSIGTFDQALFIDQVDSEYCYRAILKGYRIIQFENIYLQHNLGQQSIHRSLKNLKKTNRSLHSPLRLYYMTRNYFYMQSKYQKNFPNEISELRKDLMTRIKNNFLYSSRKFSLIRNVLSGIVDYKRGKMGKKS